jgi:hypothetical protein
MEMILSFLAMKWYRIVSDLVSECKNMHNLDAVVGLGAKVINLKSKETSLTRKQRSMQSEGCHSSSSSFQADRIFFILKKFC